MTELHIPIVNRLGQPCWSSEAAEGAIPTIAPMSIELEPYFVATHAPIELHDREGATLTEGELYERLFARERRNVFAVVRGEPGSGKSHLIRWLHLRCMQDIQAGR